MRRSRSIVKTLGALLALGLLLWLPARAMGEMCGMPMAGGMGGHGQMEQGQGMEGMKMEGMGPEKMARGNGERAIGEEFVCPIDGMRQKVSEVTPSVKYRGRVYYFCNEEAQRKFFQDPDRYATQGQ